MKKYVIIAGVPRAGKSTMAKRIAMKFGYQHISMDAVLAGIENVFPETGIDTDADIPVIEKYSKISAKMARFIQAMIDSGEYDECDYGVVIDVCQLLPSDYINYIDSERCSVSYFLTSDVSAEERYAIMREHDTQKDYSYYFSESERRKSCEEIVEMSAYIKEQCLQYELPFFETAKNRRQTIDTAIEQISQFS